MSEMPKLEDFRPGDPENSTIPDMLAAKSPPERVGTEIQATKEKPPARNIEDRNLPGNLGWMGRVATSVDAKWVGGKTWTTTLPGRFNANHHARVEGMYDNRLKTLRAERMRYAEKAMQAKTKRMELGYNPSFLDRFRIGQWYKDTKSTWYSWREQRNERQVRIKDGAIGRDTLKRDRAGAIKSFVNKRITGAVDSAERRLNAKMPQIDLLQNEANEAVDRLGNLLTSDAEKSTKLLDQFEQLKQRRMSADETPDERQANDTLMEKLYGERARMESRIKHTQAKLDRCYKHLGRLERAASVSEAACARIQGRYARHIDRVGQAENPENSAGNTDDAEEPDATDPASFLTSDDFFNAEWMNTTLTPKAFIGLWNAAIPNMHIDSEEQLLDWWTIAVQNQQPPPPLSGLDIRTDIEAGHGISLTKWQEFLTQLQDVSEPFKEIFVKNAGGKTMEQLIRRVAIYS